MSAATQLSALVQRLLWFTLLRQEGCWLSTSDAGGVYCSGKVPPLPPVFSKELQSLLSALLQRQPALRPSIRVSCLCLLELSRVHGIKHAPAGARGPWLRPQ